MSSKENAIIFDDGSIESKVLQYELKTSYDITTVSVNQYQPGDLQKWIEKSIEITEGLLKGIVKIILHFPFEDYVQKDIRTEMMELQRKNPNLRIIAWYEQAPRDNIKNRAANYGIVAEPKHDYVKEMDNMEEELSDTEPFKPYEEVPGKPNRVQEQLKDIKETVIDPDDEMKREYSVEYLKEVGDIPVSDTPMRPSEEIREDIKNIASDIITNVESEGFTLHKDEPKKKGKKKKWNI